MNSSLAGMLPADHTEMQRRVLAHDWSATALGPEPQWSSTLRQVAGLTLNTRFPMLVMWGPELLMVYNDGYAEMLGDRHPDALGAPMSEVWADVWPVIGPLLEHVWAGGDATHSEDLHLVMGRSGFDEETYFTFSYSPVHDPDGAVTGIIDIAVETTGRVLAERRLRTLQRLGGLPRALHASPVEACASALEVLGAARADVPFAAAYLLAEDGVAAAVLAPLVVAGSDRPVGASLLGVSPHLRLDDDYRTFLSLAADQVAAAVTDARAVERGGARPLLRRRRAHPAALGARADHAAGGLCRPLRAGHRGARGRRRPVRRRRPARRPLRGRGRRRGRSRTGRGGGDGPAP